MGFEFIVCLIQTFQELGLQAYVTKPNLNLCILMLLRDFYGLEVDFEEQNNEVLYNSLQKAICP